MVDKMEGVISAAVPGVLDPSKYPVPIETYVLPRLSWYTANYVAEYM
jgi:U2 small nuclear ribonucleoprotein B''